MERRHFILAATAVAVLPQRLLAQTDNYPRYSDTPLTEWLSDGRRMKVVNEFIFWDKNKLAWIVPPNEIVNGASIPWFLWSIAGSPFTGLYRDAAIIHDRYFRTKERSSDDTHRVFYDAMIHSGVGRIEALSKYWAVYYFNSRWLAGGKILKTATPDPKSKTAQNQFDQIQSKIAENPTIGPDDIPTLRAGI